MSEDTVKLLISKIISIQETFETSQQKTRDTLSKEIENLRFTNELQHNNIGENIGKIESRILEEVYRMKGDVKEVVTWKTLVTGGAFLLSSMGGVILIVIKVIIPKIFDR